MTMKKKLLARAWVALANFLLFVPAGLVGGIVGHNTVLVGAKWLSKHVLDPVLGPKEPEPEWEPQDETYI